MSYKVSFYREVVNSYGKPSKASLYTTEIEASGSMDEAIAAAVAAFKRELELPCWRALADGYEVSYEARSRPIATGRRVEQASARLREELVNR